MGHVDHRAQPTQTGIEILVLRGKAVSPVEPADPLPVGPAEQGGVGQRGHPGPQYCLVTVLEKDVLFGSVAVLRQPALSGGFPLFVDIGQIPHREHGAGVLPQCAQQALDPVRWHQIVVVQEGDELPGGQPAGVAPRCGDPLVLLPVIADAIPVTGHQLSRAILGSIVQHDDLHGPIALGQRRLQGKRQPLCAVVAADDQRDEGVIHVLWIIVV